MEKELEMLSLPFAQWDQNQNVNKICGTSDRNNTLAVVM